MLSPVLLCDRGTDLSVTVEDHRQDLRSKVAQTNTLQSHCETLGVIFTIAVVEKDMFTLLTFQAAFDQNPG